MRVEYVSGVAVQRKNELRLSPIWIRLYQTRRRGRPEEVATCVMSQAIAQNLMEQIGAAIGVRFGEEPG